MFREPSYVERSERGILSGEEKAALRPSLKILSMLNHYLLPLWPSLFGALTSLVVASLSVLALGQGMRYFIDRGLSEAHLTPAVLVMFAVVVVMGIASYGRFYFVSWVGERVVNTLRQDLFDHILRLSPTFYETRGAGDLTSRLVADTSILQVVIGTSMSIALRNFLLLGGGLVMMVVTSPLLTGITLLSIPVILGVAYVYGRYVRRLARATQDAIGAVASLGEETFNSIRTIQAFTQEGCVSERFRAQINKGLSFALQNIRARGLLTAAVIIIVFAAISIVLWVGGNQVLAGKMTAGNLSAFLFYAIVVAGSLGSVSEVMTDLQRAAGACERLVSLKNEVSDIVDPVNPKQLPQPVKGALSFDHVTFAYPSRPNHLALQDVNLSVSPGETVAIVGPSGAGKSTLFQVLLRFYPYQEGKIYLEGEAIEHLALSNLRQSFGWISQDPVIFTASAYDNIAFARPSATKEEVLAAAKAAYAHDFIEELPQGYETFLGEKGMRLSGGQRQRIALARVFLKNAPILLLDEATSALDSQSEYVIQQALAAFMAQKTTLIIAHRLSTILHAHRIVVMDKGCVVGVGSHGYLLATSPLYQNLYELHQHRGINERAP